MFYLGDQWVFWNRGRLDRPRLDPWRVTLTDNRVGPVALKQLARLTKQRPAFQVVPTTDEDEDLQAALTGEKVLDFLWRHCKLRKSLHAALLWAQITGAGFWKITWDNAKGQKVQVLADETGKPVMHSETGAPMRPSDVADEQGQLPDGFMPKTIATGDVHVEVISPFEIYPDPIAKEMEDCEWLIQTAVKSTEWVKSHYGQDVQPDADVAAGPAEARLFPSWQMGGTSGYRGVTIKEYWCQPSNQHPKGRRVVWVKGKILFEDINPYPRLPYVMFKGWDVPGRFWPTSVIEQCKSSQTELNKFKSQVTENVHRVGNPALLAARQANIQYSGAPGERIDFDDTVQNAIPSYLQPPQVPQWVIEQIDRAEKSIEEISGQHEVSNAQVPAGVKAASAINLLQEADDTRLGPTISEMEEALGVAGEMLLELVAKYWTEERTIQVSGADNAWEVKGFRGAALRENTHVEVQAGSSMPRSKAAKQAAIQDVLNLIFQYQGQQPINRRMLAKLMKEYEAGALEKVFGDVSQTEAQINRENSEIAIGAELPINAFDEHQEHIEGHEEFQRTGTYKYLDPLQKQAMERHVLLHRQQLLAQMAPPQGPEQGPPQMGQPEQMATEHAQNLQVQALKNRGQVEVARARPRPPTGGRR